MATPIVVPTTLQTKNRGSPVAVSVQNITLSSNISTNSSLALVIAAAASGCWIVRILDPNSNTYTLQSSSFLYTGTGGSYLPNGKVFLYTASNVVGGYTTISIYLSGGTSLLSTVVKEVCGVVYAPVANQSVSGYSAVTQPYKSGFITPTQPNVMAFSWMAYRGTAAGTASGYTNPVSQTSISGTAVSTAELLVTTPVASSSYWNLAGTQNIQTGLLYLKGRFDDEGLNLGNVGCG